MTNSIFVLIIAGVIAGLVNYFYSYLSLPTKPKVETKSLNSEEEEWGVPKRTWQLAITGYIIIGIAGALLTPLINEIVGLKGLSNDLNPNLPVLFGYGIVFGYSTNRILTSISDNILAKVEKLITAKQNEVHINRKNIQAEGKVLITEDFAVCPNEGGWGKAPNYNSSPLKNMAWANNLPIDKFGCTRNAGNKFHAGIDVEAEVGSECFALANGIITDVGFGTELGKFIALQFEDSGNKYGAGYCHLDEIIIKKGDKVTSGQLIGKTGKTGNVGTDKPHLHLEIHKNKWLTYASVEDRSNAALDPNHYV